MELGSGKFLKVENVRDGDVVTFTNEGEKVESKYHYPDGNPKIDLHIGVKYKGNEYILRVNYLSQTAIKPVHGTNTMGWIGKSAKIMIENYKTLGTKGIMLEPCETDPEVKKIEEAWDES